MYCKKWICLFLILGVWGTAAAKEPETETRFYKFIWEGKKIGYQKVEIEHKPWKHIKKTITKTETLVVQGVVAKTTTSVTYPNGEPIYKKIEEPRKKVFKEVYISNGKVTFDSDDAPRKTIIEFRPGIGFEVPVDLVLKAPKGELQSCVIISHKAQGYRKMYFKVVKKEKDKVTVRFGHPEKEGFHHVYDTKGKWLSYKDSRSSFEWCTKKEATGKDENIKEISKIQAGFVLPAWDHLTRLSLKVKVKDDLGGLMATQSYQEVTEGLEGYDVVLKAFSPQISGALTLPWKVPAAFAPFVEADQLMTSKEATLKIQANEIREKAKSNDALVLVKALNRFVFFYLKKESGAFGRRNAMEAYKTQKGDCTEHVALFGALARSLDIPVRACYGLKYSPRFGGVYAYHAWAEAYVGQWVPVDPTVNAVGFPACYLLLAREAEGPNGADRKLTKMLGKTSVTLGEVKVQDTVINPQIPEKCVMEYQGGRQDYFWGFRFQTPKGFLMAKQKVGIGLQSSSSREHRIFVKPELTRTWWNGSAALALDIQRQWKLVKGVRVSNFKTPKLKVNGQEALSVSYTIVADKKVYYRHTVVVQNPSRTFKIEYFVPDKEKAEGKKVFAQFLKNFKN